MSMPSRNDSPRSPWTETPGAASARSPNSPPPKPGDLYVFPLQGEVTLEWLVVQEHPDDPGLLFVIPADAFALAGTPDVLLPPELVQRPLTARCGQGLWLPAGRLPSRLRVGVLPSEALQRVRQKVGELARGRLHGTEEQHQADLDPTYEDWLGRVEEAREQLQTSPEQGD